MASEWISVKEKMPPLDVDVLVAGLSKGRMDVQRGGLIHPLLWGKPRLWSSFDRIPHRKITHWMPLPEPPEAQ